jgi:hypothetical protein
MKRTRKNKTYILLATFRVGNEWERRKNLRDNMEHWGEECVMERGGEGRRERREMEKLRRCRR